MDRRRGEKLGWTGGMLGSSLWMIPVSILLLWSGRIASGLVGLGFFAMAVASSIYLAPWRHPQVAMWKLFLPCCVIIILAAILLVGLEGSPSERRFFWNHGYMFLFMLLPMLTVGQLRWVDREPVPPTPQRQ